MKDYVQRAQIVLFNAHTLSGRISQILNCRIFYVAVLPAFFAIATATRYLNAAYYPTVDTGWYFQVFAYSLAEFRNTGQFPLWIPEAAYGVTSDFFILFGLGPSQYLLLFIGKYLNIAALNLFLASIIVDQFIFLLGVALIAWRLFKEMPLIVFYCIAVSALSLTFDNQIGFDFKIFEPMPLVFYFILVAVSEEDLYFFALAALTSTVFIFGNIVYVLPFQACCASLFAIVLLADQGFRARVRALSVSVFQLRTAIAAVIVIALLAVVYLTSTRIASELASYQGRDENLETSLASFLTFGTTTDDMLFEPFNAQPVVGSGASYFGIVGITLVFLGILLERSRQFYAFLAVFLFVAFFSVRDSGVAALAYHFPAMPYFRHIALVIGSAKWLGAICGGYALARIIARKSFDASFAIAFNTVIAAIVVVFLASEIWYLHSFKPWHESFHVLTATMLILLAVLGIRATMSDGRHLAAFLVILAVCDLVVYRTILTYPEPVTPSFRSEFSDAARDHPLVRMPRAAAQPVSRFESGTNMATDYDILGAFLGVDLCAGLQSKVVTKSVDGLLQVWGALGVNGPRQDRIEDPQNSSLRAVLFCDERKLRLVLHPTLMATREEAIAGLKSGQQPVIVVGAGQAGQASSPGNQLSETEGLRVLAFRANEIRLTVRNSSDDIAWLIYGDSFHPAWQAYVDGNSSAIYEANIAFKALPIRPGTHDIVFIIKRGVFSNPWLYVGLGLIVSAGFVCLSAVRHVGRKPRSGNQDAWEFMP